MSTEQRCLWSYYTVKQGKKKVLSAYVTIVFAVIRLNNNLAYLSITDRIQQLLNIQLVIQYREIKQSRSKFNLTIWLAERRK